MTKCIKCTLTWHWHNQLLQGMSNIQFDVIEEMRNAEQRFFLNCTLPNMQKKVHKFDEKQTTWRDIHLYTSTASSCSFELSIFDYGEKVNEPMKIK